MEAIYRTSTVPGTNTDGNVGAVGVLAWIPNGPHISDQSGMVCLVKLEVLGFFWLSCEMIYQVLLWTGL